MLCRRGSGRTTLARFEAERSAIVSDGAGLVVNDRPVGAGAVAGLHPGRASSAWCWNCAAVDWGGAEGEALAGADGVGDVTLDKRAGAVAAGGRAVRPDAHCRRRDGGRGRPAAPGDAAARPDGCRQLRRRERVRGCAASPAGAGPGVGTRESVRRRDRSRPWRHRPRRRARRRARGRPDAGARPRACRRFGRDGGDGGGADANERQLRAAARADEPGARRGSATCWSRSMPMRSMRTWPAAPRSIRCRRRRATPPRRGWRQRHERGDLLAGLDLSGQDDTVATVLMDLARRTTGPAGERLAAALVTGLGAAGATLNSRPRREAPLAVLGAADFPERSGRDRLSVVGGRPGDADDRERPRGDRLGTGHRAAALRRG